MNDGDDMVIFIIMGKEVQGMQFGNMFNDDFLTISRVIHKVTMFSLYLWDSFHYQTLILMVFAKKDLFWV